MKEVKFIGVKEKTNVFSLRKEFVLEKTGRAVLYATALGVYFAELNGKRVGDAYLAPGWTSYDKILQMQKYDVTELLRLPAARRTAGLDGRYQRILSHGGI